MDVAAEKLWIAKHKYFTNILNMVAEIYDHHNFATLKLTFDLLDIKYYYFILSNCNVKSVNVFFGYDQKHVFQNDL